MASREKRPLVPSKSKQKASESSISSPDNKTKKGKLRPNLRQQIARDIIEAVATGSKLPPKLEASLPRKKALEKLKRNKELRSRVTLIKAKQKVVPNRGRRRINTEAKKTVKQSASAETKLNETGVKGGTTTENSNVNTDKNEGKGTEANAKSAKIVTKTIKKTKATKISSGDNETTTSESHETSGIVTKVNQKTGKKQSDSPKSAGKTVKTIGKKLGAKEAGNSDVLLLWDTKSTKQKQNSIDLIIEEVIASMLSDPELEESEEKEDSKTTKAKKMMVGERSFCDVEIKKEIDCEDETTEGKSESSGIEQIIQMQIPLQARKKATPNQRSLRNGKLRQLSDSGISIDIEMKKGGRLNSDDHSMEQENTSDGNIDTESCFSESSVNESRINVLSSKDNLSVTTKEKKNHLDEVIQFVSEIENNNNSDQVDTTVEARPALRSKVKTRISDEMQTDEMKIEDSKSTVEYPPINFMKIVHIPKRRNSLSNSTKKINPFAFSSEKSDGSSKSQIDQMIENIKLTIAKSIESKIYGQEKGKAFEGLSKSFDVPKIEEVVAPLSVEVQKVGLEERNEEEVLNIAEQKVKSDNSENSVPKVADTAKEIEKLVMGENQSVDSQSQNKNTDHQESVDQTTSKEVTENIDTNIANTSQMTQSSNEVAISNSEHEDNLKKPGRSKTTQELSSEKIDCIAEGILKAESSQIDDSMNTSNLTADSETSIVLNISSITEEEEEEQQQEEEKKEEKLETISVKVEPTEKTKIVQMTQVPLSEIRISEQNNELKAVSCPKTDSVSLIEEINSPSEKEHVNSNQLLTDGCDNAATSAQTKLTHSSSETEKLTASNNDSSLNVTNKESSSTSIPLSSTSSSISSSTTSSTASSTTSTSSTLSSTTTTTTITTTTTTSSPSSSSASLPESQDPKNPKEEEQKADDNKRVLRGREKQKKIEPKTTQEEEKCDTSLETQSNGSLLTEEKCPNKAQTKTEESDVPIRTRRTRESKKPAVNTNLKPKRNRKEVKKSEQQNKEETLLDNEVAKINENKYRKSVEEVKTPRGCSVPSTNVDKNQENKSQDNTSTNRSKSENDLENMQNSQRSSATSNGESFIPKDSNNENSTLDIDEKNVKTLDNLQKDSDEASTSGESLSSIIQETPEEKARKETVFRLLGLESWEKAAERLNHQKAKREQTSGLKMRIPKGRDKDKMRSRSPLKMVLKQGRADGEGDSPEFYTIQKEVCTFLFYSFLFSLLI